MHACDEFGGRGKQTGNRFLLRLHGAYIESLGRLIAELDQQIKEQVRPFAEIIALLDRVGALTELLIPKVAP